MVLRQEDQLHQVQQDLPQAQVAHLQVQVAQVVRLLAQVAHRAHLQLSHLQAPQARLLHRAQALLVLPQIQVIQANLSLAAYCQKQVKKQALF